MQKNPCPPLRPDWSSVTSGNASGNPQLKSMGNIPFGRFSVTKPQTPNPVICASVCGSLPLLFLEKNPDLFPQPRFCLCKVCTHATEISQLKLMGNLVSVCISKINHLTHTLLYCIRSWGHPLPSCAKNLWAPLRLDWSSVTSGNASGNLPTKINGKYSIWPSSL